MRRIRMLSRQKSQQRQPLLTHEVWCLGLQQQDETGQTRAKCHRSPAAVWTRKGQQSPHLP